MKEILKKYDVLNWVTAIVAAVLLWTYVITVNNPETTVTRTVPLQVIGQNELSKGELHMLNSLPSNVTLQLKGRRDKIADMVERKDNGTKITAQLNLGSIYKPGDYKLGYTTQVDIDGISVVSKSPSEIDVSVDYILTETIPVDIKFTGSIPESLNMESYGLSVSEVKVTGPKRYLDNVKGASVTIDRALLVTQAAVEGEIILLNAEGEQYKNAMLSQNADTTVFTANVEKSKEITLTVKAIPTADITEENIVLDWAPKSIVIKGKQEVVDKIDNIELAEISISKCIENDEFEYVLPVVLPEGAEPAEVTDIAVNVKVELKGVEKLTVNMPKEALPMVPDYEYIGENGIDVTMYVKTDSTEDITYEDFKLLPTYSQEAHDAGTLTEVAINVISDKYDIVVIGDYTAEVGKIIE